MSTIESSLFPFNNASSTLLRSVIDDEAAAMSDKELDKEMMLLLLLLLLVLLDMAVSFFLSALDLSEASFPCEEDDEEGVVEEEDEEEEEEEEVVVAAKRKERKGTGTTDKISFESVSGVTFPASSSKTMQVEPNVLLLLF